MIYFDQAATSFHRPPQVADAVRDALLTFGNASRSTHPASMASARMIYETRQLLAELFCAPGPERVSFTSGATESLNLVIGGLLEPNDHVITTALDHNSVLRPLYRKDKEGVELTVIPADRDGRISYQELEGCMRAGTKALICTHASNVTGNLLDIERLGEICRRHDVIFVLDASQTAGIVPIDMSACNIGALCFTGHKSLMGPQGTGGICLAEWLSLKPVKVGGSGFASEQKEQPPVMPEVLEAGTLNGHGIAGLHAALRWIQKQGIENLRRKELSLSQRFYEGIAGIPGVRVYGDFTSWDRCAVVSFTVGDCDSGAVSTMLWEEAEIACRSGMHCAYPMHQALGTESQGTVRFSFSHFNTEEEVDRAVCAVKKLGEDLV